MQLCEYIILVYISQLSLCLDDLLKLFSIKIPFLTLALLWQVESESTAFFFLILSVSSQWYCFKSHRFKRITGSTHCTFTCCDRSRWSTILTKCIASSISFIGVKKFRKSSKKSHHLVVRFVPKYGSREILCIMGSLTTCDPGNIHQTIGICLKWFFFFVNFFFSCLAELKQERVRCSVICLAAEVRIFKTLTSKTRGI